MTDRPILFSMLMVRAILDGRKTQTRRVLKPQPDPNQPIAGAEFVTLGDEPGRWCWLNGWDGSIFGTFSIPYAIGDRLWVRETWTFGADIERDDGFVVYRADGTPKHPRGRWRSPRFMPGWASRLTLIVADVRVQRVQDISEADAIAEGAEPVLVPPDGGSCPHLEGFRDLWDSLNAARGYGWDENPWVVAITFTAEQRNIDA